VIKHGLTFRIAKMESIRRKLRLENDLLREGLAEMLATFILLVRRSTWPTTYTLPLASYVSIVVVYGANPRQNSR